MKAWDYNYLFPIRCYLDSEGHETDKKMRFVDMCIEVDSHIPHWNEKDSEGRWVVDKDRQFNLIYSVCFMLVCKTFALRDGREYDDLAYFVAWDIFDKIERPRDAEHPIKSILNYIKGTLIWRRMEFQSKSVPVIFDSTFKKSWNSDRFRENLISSFESTKKLSTIDYINDELSDFTSTVMSNVPKQFNYITFKRLFISSCLTLLNCLKSKNLFASDNFRIVNYKLSGDYNNIVRAIVKKSIYDLKNSLKDVIDFAKMNEEEYNLIMGSAFGASNNDEEKY